MNLNLDSDTSSTALIVLCVYSHLFDSKRQDADAVKSKQQGNRRMDTNLRHKEHESVPKIIINDTKKSAFS